MQTLAAPPRNVPQSAKEMLMKNRPAPVMVSAVPKIRKPITRSAKAWMGMPSRLSFDSTWKAVACSQVDRGPLNGEASMPRRPAGRR